MFVFMRRFILILFVLTLFVSCYTSIYTRSGNTNSNRDIVIKVTSGNVNMNISGHISENIYVNNQSRYGNIENRMFDPMETAIVLQGKETINQQIILNENQEFKYTLTMTEAVIVNIRSVDENDARLVVFERGKNTEYIISGNNNLGQTISFKN